jgi:hypothetical protein
MDAALPLRGAFEDAAAHVTPEIFVAAEDRVAPPTAADATNTLDADPIEPADFVGGLRSALDAVLAPSRRSGSRRAA